MSPKIQTLRRESKCLRCARCQQDVAECPSGAWEQIGRDVTLDNLLQEVLKDEVFFRASGGGVTLSGGRCSCRPGLPPAFFSACASGDPHRHRNRRRRRL
jgi:pyruvate formate lyase activating enzyme